MGFDSLIIGERIELLGGGAASDIPECAGSVFHLGPGWSAGAPVPDVDILETSLSDGEVPVGFRASNRTITLPVVVKGPAVTSTFTVQQSRQALMAAVEILLQIVNQPTFSLRLTRDGCLPTLYDCYRAGQAQRTFSMPVELTAGVAEVVITFAAAPYGRSDIPVIVNFPSPLSGVAAAPAAVTLDTFSALPGNWLSGQNTGFEGGIGGWTALAACTVASSSAQAHSGGMSMALTSTGTANMQAVAPTGTLGLPVVKNQSVNVTGWFRAATAVRSCHVGVRWYDTSGNFISANSSGGTNDTTTGWTQRISGLGWSAPANGYAVAFVQVDAPAGAGEVHNVDDVVIGYTWQASTLGPAGLSALWDPSVMGVPTGAGIPGQYTNQDLAANLAQGWVNNCPGALFVNGAFLATTAQQALMSVGDQFQLAQNWLRQAGSGSVHNGDFEGTLGTWGSTVNCAIADTAAQAHSGSNSMSMTSSAAGDMLAAHSASPLTQGLAVTPGAAVFVSGWFRSAVSTRSCQAGAAFYDAAGNYLSGQDAFVTAVTDSTTGWTQAAGQVTAPAFAAFAIAKSAVRSTGGASEVHYADDMVLATAAAQLYTVTGFTPPALGTTNVQFTPNAPTIPQSGDVAVQTGPMPGLPAVTFYAGFGSSAYYHHWAKLGGLVTFTVTLTDSLGNTTSASRTQKCTGSNNGLAPVWHRIRVPLLSVTGFNYSSVAGCTIKAVNRGTHDLRYTQMFLSSLTASPPPTTYLSPVRGWVYDLAGVTGSARAPVSIQAQNVANNAVNVTQTFNTPGGFSWLCPSGVTSVSVRSWGRGGSGGNASANACAGGGSAGTGFNAAVAVTPGVTYTGTISGVLGGQPMTAPTTFTGDTVTVIGPNGGDVGFDSITAGAAGAAGTGGFAGAAGGAGVSGGAQAGGGASSAGTASAGNPGQAGASGGAGGAAVAGGGAGAHGRPTGGPSDNGATPGGGGGGGQFQNSRNVGGFGGNGQVTISYTLPAAMRSLIVHRPPVTAPAMLTPFVSPGTDDTPNGGTEYPVQTQIAGIPARFGGTYTIIASPYSWNGGATDTNARTITVTVKQYEQASGAVYSSTTQSVSVTPNSLPQLTATPSGTGFVVLGELTLPLQDLPQDNLNCFFTVTITDSQTADRFMDILFLDTMGSTVIVQSPTGYANYYLDAPPIDRDIGLIMGSVYDRADAISVIDRSIISGGPLTVDPFGSQQLFMYAMEGAPGVQMVYFPRWMEDRYQ